MISPLEIIMIAGIAVAFLLLGPKKIPELAKSIGLARKEFSQVSGQPLTSILDTVGGTGAVDQSRTTTTAISSNDSLTQTAARLGIETAGKTTEQISQEIVQKADSRGGL
jgi:sec-independent protein translocase protein TatA